MFVEYSRLHQFSLIKLETSGPKMMQKSVFMHVSLLDWTILYYLVVQKCLQVFQLMENAAVSSGPS